MAQLHDPSRPRHVRPGRPAVAWPRWLLLCGSVMAGTACADTSSRAPARDSALDRDLTLAASATPTVAIGDTAITAPTPVAPTATPPTVPPPAPAPPPRPAPRPAPRADARPVSRRPPAPAPAPAPGPAPTPAEASPAPTAPAEIPAPTPAPRGKALGAGTVLAGTTNAAICALAQRPGDRFVVNLGQAATGPDGVMLPAGTPVIVELARADSATGEFSFRLRGVQVNGEFIAAEGSVRVADGQTTERKVSKGGSDQGKVVTGAIIGGILGRVLGGGARGAVIGAAGGAAAGTIAAARNTTTERCLAAGAMLSATLTAPLTLPPTP